ncbi:MAG: hypothetical protein EOP87_07000 [Verrucomicrobiaceae bacterium]|nr:MAG: hypothetical protein EOP87_07000 [Verrucomicrobiaceae bacterium]
MKPALSVSKTKRIPLWLKIAYTGFLAVMIPVYWINYGPTNFLYFCDVALLLTLVGIWKEDALLVSLPAVGILLPQVLWCADFLVELFGGKLTGMTGYMFEEHRSLFLRGLSLFHGWLPFLLVYLVWKLGYDKRALLGWSVTCVGLCLTAYFLLPPAGAELADPKIPRNINYVFGMDDAKPQSWMPPLAYLGTWIAALTGIVFIPTHFLLRKLFKQPSIA